MDITTLNNRVWEEMVYANMRASYFGDLVRVYQERDKLVRGAVLVLTSGSMATILSAVEQPAKIGVSLLATVGSLWLFLSQYSTLSRDASDLTVAWQEIATEYERIWNDLTDPTAEACFHKNYDSANKLSRASSKFPQRGRRFDRWFKHSAEILTARYKAA